MKNYFILLLFLIIIFPLISCIKNEKTDENQVNLYYTVIFLDMNDIELFSINAIEGCKVEPPQIIEQVGYTFIGWDQDLSAVYSDLVVRPIYEKIINKYLVSFFSDEFEVKIEEVEEGMDATSPILEKEGYKFIGWDKDFSNVKEDLIVNAIWEKIDKYGSSYEEDLNFIDMNDYSTLIYNIDFNDKSSYTFSNVKSGGFRVTNELVYYDESHNFNTNIYGFEIAVDSNNIVIERATKVEMPEGGFVISGHGTSASLLEKNTKTGDIIIYESNQAKVFRRTDISNTIGLGIELTRLVKEVKETDNNYLALDYKLIKATLNEAISIYNGLIDNYSISEYNKGIKLALDIDFMLIEPTSVTVRGMWHYPLRAGIYTEKNLEEVELFLDKVKENGINRIYLNTNFNGRAIYKSDYLVTSLTTNNNYGNYKDYLECFIEESHKRGIEVYAWTNTLITGDGSNNLFYSNRGWVLKGINGEDNHGRMYFVDISNDEVQLFLKDVFHELAANYNLDGIEYDFIRFPSGNLHNYNGIITDTTDILDWGYTESFINKFMLEYHLEGNFIELIKNSKEIRIKWLSFKMEMLTNMVELLSTTIKSANPNIQVSAAVMPSISGAKQAYLQDWETWIKNGWIDELDPMIYTADNNYLENSIINMMTVVKDYAKIVGGIHPEGNGGSSYMNAKQIAILERLGILGVSKFSSRTIFNSNLASSMKYMDRDYIVLPTEDKFTIFNAYKNNLNDKISNYYLLKDNDEALVNILGVLKELEEPINFTEVLNQIESLISKVSNDKIKSHLMKEHQKIKNTLG